jgi:hypothetical protein
MCSGEEISAGSSKETFEYATVNAIENFIIKNQEKQNDKG